MHFPIKISLTDGISRLSVHQMMRLFGPVREDQQGRPFVLVEDKETLPRFNADSEDEGDED